MKEREREREREKEREKEKKKIDNIRISAKDEKERSCITIIYF